MKTIEILAGDHIVHAIGRAKDVAKYEPDATAHLKFNGINLYVKADSNVSDICQIYDLKCEIDRYKQGYIK